MATLKRTMTIDAPVEKVFDYALDIRNLWDFPDMGLADVDLKPDGEGSSARIFAHFLGFHLEMGLKYTEVVRPERIVAEISGFGFDNPTWTLTFKPVDERTKLTVTGEWHINVPAVGGAMEGMMVREHKDFVETMLSHIRAGVEPTSA